MANLTLLTCMVGVLSMSVLLARLALLMGFLSLSACWSNSGASFVSVASKIRSTRTAVHIGNGYQERMSPRDHDKTFFVADATGATAEVTYKKRPFGILRYSPGKDHIGAMVMEIIPKSRYPGDPQGQAFAAGVTSGRVLKSINGKDVSGMEFAHIMDLLDDEVMDQRMSQHFYASEKAGRLADPVDLPITVVYQEGAGQDIEWPQMKEDIWEGFTR
ncbi:unnamed protein product [Polarella glacialis]|uniref:PDZ domain-containing protein n=1 Tax=Polarella glacialis TaxID=89957 RepID=A0A813L274_POLGL|nr:unnamed protein product [Polarella glacialis]